MLTIAPDADATRDAEAGFTIVEVMVSTAILLLVLAMCFGTLVSLTRSEDRANRLVSNEQNVRFELNQLAREIRAANPLVPLPNATTASDYDNQIEMVLGPTGGTQKVVRWTYDTTTLLMARQVMSDTSSTATVLSQSFFLHARPERGDGTSRVLVLRPARHRSRRAGAHERRQRARRRQLRRPGAHRDLVGLEPRSGAVHGDAGRGSPQPASRKRGVRMMQQPAPRPRATSAGTSSW